MDNSATYPQSVHNGTCDTCMAKDTHDCIVVGCINGVIEWLQTEHKGELK